MIFLIGKQNILRFVLNDVYYSHDSLLLILLL